MAFMSVHVPFYGDWTGLVEAENPDMVFIEDVGYVRSTSAGE
jgi:hypothetical protein